MIVIKKIVHIGIVILNVKNTSKLKTRNQENNSLVKDQNCTSYNFKHNFSHLLKLLK